MQEKQAIEGDRAPLQALFIGDGDLLIRCAEIYIRAGHSIVGVVTSNGLVAGWARQAGIAVFDWPDGSNPELGPAAFDYLFSIANLRVIPTETLARARRGAINFHDSALPAYAGLNATSWAIMAGETSHGITWHEMTAEIDGGRILRQHSFPITPDDTAFTLNVKCYETAAESFDAVIEALRSDPSPFIEQKGPRRYFGRGHRPEAAATIDLGKPADQITTLARALDFGAHQNPLGRAKLFLGNDVLLVRSAEIAASRRSGPAGRLVSVDQDRLVVSCADADICFAGLIAAEGSAPHEILRRNGFSPGDQLPLPEKDRLASVTRYNHHAASFEAWWSREFERLAPAVLPYPRLNRPGESKGTAALEASLEVAAAGSPQPEHVAAAFVGWVARLTGASSVSVSYSDASFTEASRDIEPWFVAAVPLTMRMQDKQSVGALIDSVAGTIDGVRRAGPYCCDLPFRVAGAGSIREALDALRIGIDLAPTARGGIFDRCDVVLSVDPANGQATLVFPSGGFTAAVSRTIARHFNFFLGEFLAGHAPRLDDIPLVPPEERAAVEQSNRTMAVIPDACGIAQEIVRQVHRDPQRAAICWDDRTLDYAALEARAGVIAERLKACGACRGTIIGIHLERTPDLIAAVLATLSIGAAYLPLDPAYPAERIRFMLEDSRAPIVLTDSRLAGRVARDGVALVMVDSTIGTPANAGDGAGLDHADTSPDDLAYVIYTSGSTGLPKGVAVTHGNVLNFFAGMDARIPHGDGGRWLAVTSLSFDISVLELLWTLARGFTVVLHSRAQGAQARPDAVPAFSLFYFASDEASGGADKYRLLLEGAKFADREGFAAVWTPERHFHAFGGLYPNAAITSAAIAAVTQRVAIRAGSCVLPLHNPVRAAEDWALVDNLSNGRVGISLASGWQPNDFVIAPEAFADRKNIMISGVDTLRRLWRGEKVPLRNPKGEAVAIGTLPRPVQREIPLWLTAAGNPETFQQAGQLGCGLLTHLLGQSLDDLAKKVGAYRRSWQQAGHVGNGHVTLMLHAFVGESDDLVRETVRQPMKNYLRSSMDLIKLAAWSFPTFVERATAAGRQATDPFDAEGLSDAEMDAILDHAFERYFATSGLFGTVERCRQMVTGLAAIGIDEIACLIDFGVPTEQVLESLPRLKQLMDAAAEDRRPIGHASVAEDIVAHRASHLQCTPSMASMLIADGPGRSALAGLETLVVGGEALPVALAKELRSLVPGKLLNAYGPTEATVWSSICDIEDVGEFVPLGTPIANTSLHVLDPAGRECPALITGELYIGGAGLARGYLGRPELTKERFIRDPLGDGSAARLYRTGDLVRRHPDGALEFIGRIDNQVKIRGHRVELGEIEGVLANQPGVKDAVVHARLDGTGDQQLLAYVTPRAGAVLDGQALRQRIEAFLPEVMVPARVIVLPALPLTPNGKVDRAALAACETTENGTAGPEGETEALIAAIWCEFLRVPSVNRTANFFDLGGHSLMVIKVQRRLQAATGQNIPIVDMFSHSTIRALAALIDSKGQPQAQTPIQVAIDSGVNRARARRALLQRQVS
jgi:natural product biosynthesis luciferase-like monooxygenase protein